MSEYRNALIRNGFIAIIISILVVGIALYGSGSLANNVRNFSSNTRIHLTSNISTSANTNLPATASASSSSSSFRSQSYSKSTTTSSTLSQTSVNAVIATVSVNQNLPANSIEYDVVNGDMYVSGCCGYSALTINSTTNTIDGHPSKAPPTYDPYGQYAYSQEGKSLLAYNSHNLLVANVSEPPMNGTWLSGFLYDPANGYVYVAVDNCIACENNIIIIDAHNNSIIGEVPTQPLPAILAYFNGNLYFSTSAQYNGGINVLNTTTNSVVNFVRGGGAFAIDTANGNVYFATLNPDPFNDTYPESLTVANKLLQVVTTIQLHDTPVAAAYDPNNNALYVSSVNNDLLYMINASTNVIVNSVQVGHAPIQVSYNPVNSEVYVLNYDDGTVSVIKP